jgi:amino acid transporter
MPSVQSFYQILSQLTALLYLIMYMLMFASAIILRYRRSQKERPFRLGGNGTMWLIAGVGFLGSLLAFVLSFIPPAQIATGSTTVWFSVLVGGAFIVIILPFIIYSLRKPTWRNKSAIFAPFEWEQESN